MKVEILVARSAAQLEISIGVMVDDGWTVRFETFRVVYDAKRKLLIYSILVIREKGE